MTTLDESRPSSRRRGAQAEKADDPLMVMSVDKAFRVLSAFGRQYPTLNLSQVAAVTGMDISSAQRFTHTLTRLGYLRKDPETKRFELTAKTLEVGHHFFRSSRLVDRAMPYLMHLSKETEETVNLTMLDDTDIIFVSRFLSRHMLHTDVIIGSRMPAYCSAPGIAMLSRLPEEEALALLDRSDLQPHTPSTTWQREALIAKIDQARDQGYATAFEEFYLGDASIAAPVLDHRGRPEGAVNIAVSCSRYAREEVVARFSPLIIATSRAISRI